MAATFGAIQKSLRESFYNDGRAMTQEELVLLLNKRGVKATQAYIAKIEKSRTEPRRDYVRAICEIFNRHPLFVLGMTDRPLLLSEVATVDPSSALTPEGKHLIQLTDSLPTDFRVTLVTIAKAFAQAAETEKAKAELDRAWEMQWDLVERIGGVALKTRLEKELGIHGGQFPMSTGEDKLRKIFSQFTSDSRT